MVRLWVISNIARCDYICPKQGTAVHLEYCAARYSCVAHKAHIRQGYFRSRERSEIWAWLAEVCATCRPGWGPLIFNFAVSSFIQLTTSICSCICIKGLRFYCCSEACFSDRSYVHTDLAALGRSRCGSRRRPRCRRCC